MPVERIQNRRGTSAAWEAANPVLFLGEFGVELTSSDEIKVKVGDGETSWDDLPYISSDVDLSAYYTSTQTNSAITAAITSAATTINIALAGKSNTDHTHTLDSLSDVSSSTATNGQYLRFNGTSWVAGSADAPSSVSYDDLTDVPTEFPPEDHTHTISDITGITATATEINLLDGVLATTTEINYLDGVTSNIQDQISGRAPLSHTHPISDITNLSSTITDIQSAISGVEYVNSYQQQQIDELLTAPSASASMVYSTTTTYSLLSSNVGNIVSISNASPITFTVNNVFDPGQDTTVYKKGDGIITFTAGSGVTLEGAGVSGVNLKLTNKFGAVNIFCERAGVYAIIGDVEIA